MDGNPVMETGTDASGVHTLYEYDTDGNIIHLRLKKADGETLYDWQYEYDLNGNRTAKAGCFADLEDKLCNTVIRYRYDQMDRLVEEAYDDETVQYLYDLCGNRLKWKEECNTIIMRSISRSM